MSSDTKPAAVPASATPPTADKPAQPRNRKGVVYHPEFFSEGTPSRSYSKESKEYKDAKGYVKAKSKSDDYRKSSSDEYKRRQYEEERKVLENQEMRDGFSTKCRLITMCINLLLMFVLIGVLIFVVAGEEKEDQVTKGNATDRLQVRRKGMAIATDNLECSILMKRFRMQDMRVRSLLLAGLMCLYINEPHSVAPDSGFSVQFYFQQNRATLSDAYEQNFVRPHCKENQPMNTECDLRGFHTYHAGLISLDGKRIAETKFFQRLAINASDNYRNHYQNYFRRMYGLEDYGPDVYPEVNQTKGFKVRGKMGNVAIPHMFQVSRLFHSKVLSTGSNPDLFSQNFLDRFGYRNISNIVSKAKNKLTVDLVRHVIHKFLHSTDSTREVYTGATVNFMKMYNSHEMIGSRMIQVVKGNSLSSITALIINLVFAYQRKHTNNANREAHLYANLMVAQQIVYEEYVDNKSFREGNFDGLLDKTIKKMEDKMKSQKPISECKVRRNSPDRVASILLWTSGSLSTVTILNAGLPHLFWSDYVRNTETTDRNKHTYTSFEKDGVKTDPVTSAAGVMIFEKGNELKDEPVMAVTASGSIRTVDAVATTVLRMILLDETPGNAANASSLFYDTTDGKFYCDKELINDTKLFGKIAHILNVSLDSLCQSVVNDKANHNDRKIMAMSRKLEASSYIVATVRGDGKSLNYPVGY